MPVLGDDDVIEPARQSIDERDDLVASIDRQRPARHEIGLQVDREKDVLPIDRDFRGHRDQLLLSARGCAPTFALIVQNDDQREHQLQGQIQKPEHQQGGDDIRLRRAPRRSIERNTGALAPHWPEPMSELYSKNRIMPDLGPPASPAGRRSRRFPQSLRHYHRQRRARSARRGSAFGVFPVAPNPIAPIRYPIIGQLERMIRRADLTT